MSSGEEMESEDSIDSVVRDELKTWAGFHEVHRVKSYIGYRRTPKGGTQTVTIQILDLGPARPDLRYSCQATSEDGKFATGNPAPTIDQALSIVHWDALDREESPEAREDSRPKITIEQVRRVLDDEKR